MKKRVPFVLITVLAVAVFAPIVYWHYSRAKDSEPVYFGVSFGGQTVSDAKVLIDKVKGYTNFFLVNSWDLCTNETALNEVCSYVAESGLDFMVYFSWISKITYPWHQTWLDSAPQRWGERFLGIYLFDEPGGKQVDKGSWNEDEETVALFENASNYSETATLFVETISTINSTLDLKRRNIPIFTSDYALYWFDYLAGYDTVFAELAWNHSRTQQIGLCRGAANVQGKEWGAIITWTYDNPPYLESGPEILEDMRIAYEAGAKYVIIFNYPVYPEGNPYGILSEDHFVAMQQFWNHIREHPEDHGKTQGTVAFVLPKDYGWGMRRADDLIWGKWPADNLSSLIWGKMSMLEEKYGLQLDIIYDDPRFNLTNYAEIFYWNT